MIVYNSVLILMTMIGSAASLFLKKASSSESIIVLLHNRNLFIGGVLYLCASILNILILRVLDYSVVLPLTSLTYVWTMFLSSVVLKERITEKKIVGVMLVLVGAIFVSVGT